MQRGGIHGSWHLIGSGTEGDVEGNIPVSCLDGGRWWNQKKTEDREEELNPAPQGTSGQHDGLRDWVLFPWDAGSISNIR